MAAQIENFRSLFQVSLERAEAAVAKIQKRIDDALNASAIPEQLFHYTDDAGLFGILTSGTLWLTDITRLNDPSEIQHGIDIAIEELKRTTSRGQELEAGFASAFEDALKNRAATLARHFVCCFSTRENELSQWRAYAANATGFALAFDGAELENVFMHHDDHKGRQALPMSYSEDQLRALHREIIDSVLPEVLAPFLAGSAKRKDFKPYLDFLARLATVLARSPMLNSMRFKHSAYEIESEYRYHEIFGSDVPNLKYRARRHSLVPYREFDWRSKAPNSLKKIIVGPAAPKEIAISFANECLTANQFSNVTVEVSEIPYRAI